MAENLSSDVADREPADRDALLALFAAFADGDDAEGDGQRLADRLREDAAARKLYLEWGDLHANLALAVDEDAAGRQTADVAPPGLAAEPVPAEPVPAGAGAGAGAGGRGSRRSVRTLAVTLVALLVGGVWSAATLAGRAAALPPVATLIEANGAVWSDASLPTRAGGEFAAGPVSLEEGRASLRMASGAELTLRAPVRLQLLDAKAVRLTAGALAVRAPDGAVGFRVVTPTADVVDLGTEFGVAVEGDGSTEVHVSRGVVVARSSGGSGVVPIVHEEAGRIDAAGGGVAPVPFDAARFPDLSRDRTRPAAAGTPADGGTPVAAPLPPGSRLVFLGDNSVDNETHLLLLDRAFVGSPPGERPELFNAGIAFPFWYDEENFQRHVAAFRPTHAVVGFHSELALRSRPTLTAEDFSRNLRRMVRRLERDGIEPILATGPPVDARHGEAAERGARFNEIVREVARGGGHRLAEVEDRFRSVGDRGVPLLAPNARDLSLEGHRETAAALLAALGRPDLTAPTTLADVRLEPGVIADWRLRYRTDRESLTTAEVAALDPAGDDWRSLTLPQSMDRFTRRLARPGESQAYRDRLRGFANLLFEGGDDGVVGVAELEAAEERDAFLNAGGGLQAVWLNGRKVFGKADWSGSHAGAHRAPIRLRAGTNRLVIEAGNSFFLSVTNRLDWPLQGPPEAGDLLR